MPFFILMQIRIRLYTLMWIRIRLFTLNADPDPILFHFDADLDPAPQQSDANLLRCYHWSTYHPQPHLDLYAFSVSVLCPRPPQGSILSLHSYFILTLMRILLMI
jgi:hypothetical protein